MVSVIQVEGFRVSMRFEGIEINFALAPDGTMVETSRVGNGPESAWIPAIPYQILRRRAYAILRSRKAKAQEKKSPTHI